MERTQWAIPIDAGAAFRRAGGRNAYNAARRRAAQRRREQLRDLLTAHPGYFEQTELGGCWAWAGRRSAAT